MTVDWIVFGNCCVVAIFVTALVRYATRGILVIARMPKCTLAAFLVVSSIATIEAGKTNILRGVAMRMLSVEQSVNMVSEEEIGRGYRLVGVTTNENPSYTLPTNGIVVGNWHKRGTFGEWMPLDLGGFEFPFGTNGAVCSAVSVFSDGKIRPTPRDIALEIRAVGVPMLAMQGVSRFWTVDCDDGAKLLTWEEFFLNADTNAPINAQIRLSANGDFTTSSNGVESVFNRINSDDWDGDGLANEKDENPRVWDGDFYGVANALPDSANTNAYYLLDMRVSGALDYATISVTCDGSSTLGNHVIIARKNEIIHVPLLAGATYSVWSNLPIVDSAVSSEYAKIITNSTNQLTVNLPLDFSFERVVLRDGTESYVAHTLPIDVMPEVLSVVGSCCAVDTIGGGLSWMCFPTCTCGGIAQPLESTVIWEGYTKVFTASVLCGCGFDSPPPLPQPQSGPYGASVSVGFEKDAVIFENGYTNTPEEIIGRRSTATTLTIHANGGLHGGVLMVSGTNLEKLQKNSGPALPSSSVIVPAGQSLTYEIGYVGIGASSETNDIVIAANLVENESGEVHLDAAALSAIRVELESLYAAPKNKDLNRHVYGVREALYYHQYPSDANASWTFFQGDQNIAPVRDGRLILPATTNLTSGGNCGFRVVYGNSVYTNAFRFVLPRIEARNPRCNEDIKMVQGEAGWLVLHLDYYLEPSYVSFQGLQLREIPDESGNCPHEGYYDDVSKGGYLSHCALAGAGPWHEVTSSGYWCSDRIGRAGRYEKPWTNGWKEWPIPIGWGFSGTQHAQFDSPPTTQKFTLTNTGVFSIRKFGIEATRDTSNHIAIRNLENE